MNCSSCRRGKGQVALLCGEAGIGKSLIFARSDSTTVEGWASFSGAIEIVQPARCGALSGMFASLSHERNPNLLCEGALKKFRQHLYSDIRADWAGLRHCR
jgi:hypothetical protein